VSAAIPDDEQNLRDQIGQAEQKLGDLEGKLRAVEGELEALSPQHHQYRILEQACGSLEELDRLGASHLFWGDQGDGDHVARQLGNVREQVDNFTARVAEIEGRRKTIIKTIDGEQEVLDFLHDDLLDALEQEERRKAEWVIEREPDELPYRGLVMPWARGGEEDRRFHKSLAASMLISVLIGFLLQLVDLPILDRAELIEVPERVAKLLTEELKPPPPQPVVEDKPREEEQPEPEPEPLLAEEQPPKEVPKVVDAPVPAEAQQEAPKQQVESKGILAFRESFASRATSRPSAQLGSQARIGNSGEAAIGRPERSMVTTQAPGSSGGINLAALSRDVGGGGDGQQIEGVQVTRVASSIGGDGSSDRPLSSDYAAGRTDEEIQIVFDRYKAALYRLYNRELRRDPTLRGQMVLRLTIEPDGTVSLCQLQSSDMAAPTLADQVVDRVRSFEFGAKQGISAMTIIYPIDFLPAA
jgi:outer membrane biosynthesis protein TonB